MSQEIESLYGDLSDTKPTSGIFMCQGVHDLEISQVAHTSPGYKGTFFCVRATVIATTAESVHPIGSSVDWLARIGDGPGKQNLDGARLGRSAARGFVATALGVPFNNVDVETLKMVSSDAQPLAKTKMRATCTQIKTKGQADFTKVIWQLLEVSPSLKGAE